MPMIFPATLFEDEVFQLRAGLLGSPEIWDKQTERRIRLVGPAAQFLAAILDLARHKYGAAFADAQQVRGILYEFCNEMASHPVRSGVFLSTTQPAEFFGRPYHGG